MTLLKKILVVVPVALLGVFYLLDHSDNYVHIKNKRLFLLGLSFLLFYGWIFIEVFTRKQKDFFQTTVQASFYVYIFMVLTLTGYFILFREVSMHDWWQKMMVRIERRDHVNFKLFKMFDIYKVLSRQIIGNFIMLLPLGVFLPLLYKNISNFFLVFFVSLIVSATIELLQLITSFRSADVDDIFLNTSGACVGFIIYKLVAFAIKPNVPTTTAVSLN